MAIIGGLLGLLGLVASVYQDGAFNSLTELIGQFGVRL
jgi:hypothetical protein